MRITEPLPNCFSICDSAAASALVLFSSMMSSSLCGFVRGAATQSTVRIIHIPRQNAVYLYSSV
jgi:hypothetical protein